MSWTTHYRQIHRPTVRSRARSAALDAAAAWGAMTGRTRAALAGPRVHFVYLHHVFVDEVAPFRRLVDELLKVMTPLSYGDAVERAIGGPIDRPYVAFSFDDGFKNNLVAADVLDAAGVKACFFVCPQIVGEADRAIVAAFARDKLHLPPTEFMDWDDLAALKSQGHEVGNHTWSHERLGIEHPDPASQIAGAAEAIRRRLGGCDPFAWPYGHAGAITAEAIRLAFAAGHRSVASGIRGAHVVPAGDARSLCIRRDHVIAAWPARQTLYLLARSARRATASDNAWPVSW